MGLNVDTDKALELSNYKGQFESSLRQVIDWANKDPRITSEEQLAYLLATAKIESGYSLQRWEADYMCGLTGVMYSNKPCERALDYYRSTAGKINYYSWGTDPNGLPYFGRGLIQLTGPGNYRKYGQEIGVNLIANPDKALIPKNSYRIAVAYMHDRGTFDKVKQGDLYGARKTIGSGGKANEVAAAYRTWLAILKKSEKKKLFESIFQPKKENPTQSSSGSALIITLGVLLIAGTVVLAIRKLKK